MLTVMDQIWENISGKGQGSDLIKGCRTPLSGSGGHTNKKLAIVAVQGGKLPLPRKATVTCSMTPLQHSAIARRTSFSDEVHFSHRGSVVSHSLSMQIWRTYVILSGIYQAVRVGTAGLRAGVRVGRALVLEQTTIMLHLLSSLAEIMGSPYAELLW